MGGRRKVQSITQSKQVRYCPSVQDIPALAFVETHIMRERKLDDCTEIHDSEIIRYCVKLAYKNLKQLSRLKKGEE